VTTPSAAPAATPPASAKAPVRVPAWAVASLVGGVVLDTWLVIGPSGTQWSDNMYGPYDVPVAFERATVPAAVVLSIAGVLGLAVPALRSRARRSVTARAAPWLVLAAVTGAAGWRVETAAVSGANIGGGMVFLLAPPLIAALTATAAAVECRSRHLRTRRTLAAVGISCLIAPLLYAAQSGLGAYD
jgi:hypothetical protein